MLGFPHATECRGFVFFAACLRRNFSVISGGMLGRAAEDGGEMILRLLLKVGSRFANLFLALVEGREIKRRSSGQIKRQPATRLRGYVLRVYMGP
jgi:hypothetical protein